jgi:two-component system sensor histidine kinase RegB
VDATDSSAVESAWYLRLRWWACWALTTGALGTWALRGADLPLAGLLALVGVALASNAVVARRPAWRSSPGALGGLLALDTTLLTVALQLTGGPTNPFSLVYLVVVTLAATMLEARWSWGLAAYSVAAYGSLFFLGSLEAHHHLSGDDFASHLRSMWLALALAVLFVAYFASRLHTALRTQARQLAVLAAREERTRHLMSVMTLAAGAAHELGSPLGTIGLVASELGRRLETARRPAEELEDVRLIGSEVQRCRAILERMRPEAALSEPAACDLRSLVDRALQPLDAADRLRVSISGDGRVTVRAVTLEQIIRVLVSNALDAASSKVDVRLDVGVAALTLTVADDGPGMDAETLARAGEPFFTTKAPGRGTGLGLFVARAAAGALGATVGLSSSPGAGTVATLTVPRQEARP